jgi:hypothetical protein
MDADGIVSNRLSSQNGNFFFLFLPRQHGDEPMMGSMTKLSSSSSGRRLKNAMHENVKGVGDRLCLVKIAPMARWRAACRDRRRGLGMMGHTHAHTGHGTHGTEPLRTFCSIRPSSRVWAYVCLSVCVTSASPSRANAWKTSEGPLARDIEALGRCMHGLTDLALPRDGMQPSSD